MYSPAVSLFTTGYLRDLLLHILIMDVVQDYLPGELYEADL